MAIDKLGEAMVEGEEAPVEETGVEFVGSEVLEEDGIEAIDPGQDGHRGPQRDKRQDAE